MLQVKRGRGGGYFLKEPSPLGIIRQSFPFFAAQQSSAGDLAELMWELNSTNLRSAAAELSKLGENERLAALHDLELLLHNTQEPERFIFLQQALARIADCPLVDIFARCVVSYQARLMSPRPFEGPLPMTQEEFLDRELAILTALRAHDIETADRALRLLQDRMLELMRFIAER